MRILSFTSTFLTCLAGVAVSSCDGDGGSSSPRTVVSELEPNDTAAQARGLGSGRPGRGSLAAPGDVDFWAAKLKQGNLVKVEVYGSRLNQAAWDASGTIPRLKIWDRDGTTVLLEHDLSGLVAGNGPWAYGKHDLDIPLWRVPADGKFFFSVQSDSLGAVGGEYAITVRKVANNLAQTVESEPIQVSGENDTFATAQALDPSLLHGWHVDNEQDWYEITIPGPSIAHLEVVAYRNGVVRGDDSYYDPRLAIFASDGTTLVQADSDSAFADPRLDTALDAGTYFVRVDEDGDAGDGQYFLSYSRESLQSAADEVEPNDATATATPTGYGKLAEGELAVATDVDLFRFPGFAGQMVALQLWDESNSNLADDDVSVTLLASDGVTAVPVGGGGGQQIRTALLQSTGNYFIRVEPDASFASTKYHLRVQLLRQAGFESEVNNTTAQADKSDSKKRAAGAIDPVGDLDIFSFKAGKNRLVTLQIYASAAASSSNGFPALSGFGSDLQPMISIRDASGATLAVSHTVLVNTIGSEGVVEGLPVAAVSFVSPATGMYFAKISADDGTGGSSHSYLIELR